MPIIYRSVKGSELTSDEVDGNFQFLSDEKQDLLTFDSTPTSGSSNPVTSDGIYDAISAISGSNVFSDTGVLTFEGLSYNSSTTINIGAVTGQIVNNETIPSSPTVTSVSYAGATGVLVTTVGSGLASYVMLNSAGVISFQNTFPTNAERKTKIYLGKIGHPSGTINASAIGNEPDYVLSPIAQLRALYKSIGFVNNGVAASANGANLNFNISAGTVTHYASNFVADRTIPNEIAVAGATPQSFLYRTQTGTGGGFVTAIDPTMYDVGGVITAIPGGGATSTNQYIYCVPGLGFIVQYGQTTYTSLTNAIAAVGKESFTVYPSLSNNAILVGVLSLTKNATALNNTSSAQFFTSDKFGQAGGSTAGVSTATLQSAYNNSLQPQIVTSTTLGSVEIKRGSAADTDKVFEILNGAGTSTFSITGNGDATVTGSLLTGSTTFNLLNATPTTINFAGNASTALNIGHASGTNTVLGSNRLTNVSLLDTTYKSALDVSATNTLRVGNGFTTTTTPSILSITNSTTSGSSTTGALIVTGGVGITGVTNIGTAVNQQCLLNIRNSAGGTAASFQGEASAGSALIQVWNTAAFNAANLSRVELVGLNASSNSKSTGVLFGGYQTATNGSETTTCGIQTYASGTQSTRFIINGGNISFFTGSGSFGSGTGVVYMANAAVVPTTNPSGGGILYVTAGALTYRGSGGTVTTLGPA